MVNEKKKKNSPEKRQAMWLFLGWILISGIWLIFSFSRFDSHCPPSYYGNYDELVSYAEILSLHSIYISAFDHPIFIFLIFNIVALILLFRAKRALLALLIIPVEAFACLAVFGIFLCGDGTQLYHSDTLEFDGNRYHLASGDDVAGGMDVFSQLLVLFECNLQRDECHGRVVADSYSGNLDNPQLEIVNEQLRVIANGEIVFRLDSRNLELASMPGENQLLSVGNIDSIQNFAEIHFDTPYHVEWLSNEEIIVSGANAFWYHQLNTDSISTSSVLRRKGTILSFNPISRQVAIRQGYDDSIAIWDVGNTTELMVFPNSDKVADFSSNGKLLATTNNGQPTIYNAEDYSQVASLEMDDGISGIGFSPNNLFLLAWVSRYNDEGVQGFVHIWNIETQDEVFFYQAQTDYMSIPAISFSPDSQFITIPSIKPLQTNVYPPEFEQYIHVLDYQAETEVLTVSIPSDWGVIKAVSWSQDGSLLIVSTGNSLSFWNAHTGDMLKLVEIPEGVAWFSPLALSSDGTILTLGINGGIQFWTVPATGE
jgi:WD40 repeat protein